MCFLASSLGSRLIAASLCLIASNLFGCLIASPQWSMAFLPPTPGGVWEDSNVSSPVDLRPYKNILKLDLARFPASPSAVVRWNSPKCSKWMVKAKDWQDCDDDLLLPYLASLPNLKPDGRVLSYAGFGGNTARRYIFDLERPSVDVTNLLTICERWF